MSFSMMGTRGQVRMRLRPARKSETIRRLNEEKRRAEEKAATKQRLLDEERGRTLGSRIKDALRALWRRLRRKVGM